MFHFYRTKSLRKAWYALIIVASILPVLVLSPWLAKEARDLLLERAMMKAELVHQNIATRMSLETERLRTMLLNKTDPVAFFMRQGNMLAAESVLKRIGEREPVVNTVVVYNTRAQIQLTVKYGEHSTALVDENNPAFVIPMYQRTFLGSPQRLPDGHYEFVISVPVIWNKEVLGVMVATVNVDEFWQSIRRHVSSDAKVYLVDARGVLLNQVADSRVHQGALLSGAATRHLLERKSWKSSASYTGFEGQDVFSIVSVVDGLQWGIISEIPASHITSGMVSILFALVAIVFLLHVAFGLLALLLSKRLLRPFDALASVVRSATQGDYSRRAKASGYQEIDVLTTAFNRMMSTIADREARLKETYHAIEHAGESIMIVNDTGRIDYVNAAFCRLTGYSKDEVLGKKPSEIPGNDEQHEAFYQEVWATISRGESWEGELTNRRKDGSLYTVSMSISPVFEGDEIRNFIAIQKDIGQQRLLEEQLRQAQKMESLGTLVGGIAHDFNNLLAGILGNMYLARGKLEKNKPAAEVLEKVNNIEQSCQQAATMIAHLLAFARQDIVQMQDISLHDVLQESLKLARVSIPENIQVTYEAYEQDMQIHGDSSQLQQVLLNLLNNAKDAVAESATPAIHVMLRCFHPDHAFIQKYPDAEGKVFACITVEDNGCGIPQSDLEQIFDPFFTTKSVGKGTGLGLSMVYGAMQRHQGILDVSSVQGEGTMFYVYLPLLEEKVLPTDKVEEVYDAATAHGEMILLADDEHMVRETTAEILELMGYRVLQAADGLQALAMFEAHQDDIVLLILDMVMPHGGGVGLAEKMRCIRSDIPIIFVTGYDEQPLLQAGADMENSAVLSKPVPFHELTRYMQHMLNGDANQ